MARKTTFQRGSVEVKNGKFTLRYRLRTGLDQWQDKRETLINPETMEPCVEENEAQQVAQARMVTINRINNNLSAGVPTLEVFASTLWKQYLEEKEAKPSTRLSYASIVNKHLLPTFGRLQIDKITPVLITEFLTRVGNVTTPAFTLKCYSLLRVMFEVACQYDLMSKSPVRSKIHRPKVRWKEKASLTSEQIRAVMGELDFKYKMLLLITSVMSLRISEALGLRWMNFDLEAKELSVTHGLWRGKLIPLKTASSARTFHLPDALAGILSAYKAQCEDAEPDSFVFCRPDGSPLHKDSLRRDVLYPAMDRAGIVRTKQQYGWHIFRHSGGSILHEITHDLKQVQTYLRHAQSSTTDIYVHTSAKVAREATEIVAGELIDAAQWSAVLTVSQESDAIN